MKIYHTLESFEPLPNAIVTSGTFDGVHQGHSKILSRLTEVAEQQQGETVVLTFWPHPRMVVSEDSHGLQLLSTIEEKTELFRHLKIDHLIISPFTRAFSELSPTEFIQQVLVDKIGTKRFVIGYDHRFGRNREGGFDFLQKVAPNYGIKVEEIPRQDIDALAISSTRIRKALLAGDVQEASYLLGRPYQFSGVVVKGKQLGRTLGYPTANIEIKENYKLIPANGVYAVKIQHRHNTYNGMLNIGIRPTVDGTSRTIEVNIFDFDQDIYGERLTVELVAYLRPEMKFENLDQLISQIIKDKVEAIEWLAG